jgi:hypothetical protein
MINKIYKVLSSEGFSGLSLRLAIRFAKLFPRRISGYKKYTHLFSGAGIEFGGPSENFRSHGYFPLYETASFLDNCNFSSETPWEKSLTSAQSFYYHPKKEPGMQFCTEATDLHMIENETYDFVASCHMLEHSANPIKVLHEWQRILKDSGTLLLLLPHKDATFDKSREITSLEHLIDDFECEMDENDKTHIDEAISLYNQKHDLGIANPLYSSFFNEELMKDNFKNRLVHHHVFNLHSAVKMIDFVNFEILHIENILGKTRFGIHNSIAILCKKNTLLPNDANLHFIKNSIELDGAEFNL